MVDRDGDMVDSFTQNLAWIHLAVSEKLYLMQDEWTNGRRIPVP